MIKYSQGDDGIAILSIDQSGRSMNVIDWTLGQQLAQALERAASDASVKGLVITSAKSSFVAGADLAIMQDFIKPGVTLRAAADLIGSIGNVLRRMEQLGKPVVGASPGTALGGGLEILLACHYRVAAENAAAQYGLPEVKLGLLPGAGGTQRLPRLIGLVKAIPLLVEGRSLRTAEALALGLLQEVVPADQLLTAARRAITENRVAVTQPWDVKGYRLPGGDSSSLAMNDLFTASNARATALGGGNFPAPRAILSCVYEGSRLRMDTALDIEKMYFAQLVQGPVAQGLIRTQFFARQAADKLVRRPQGIAIATWSRLGVLGAGFMGQGIAQVAAQAGMGVVLVDRDQATADAALASVRAHWNTEVAKGRMTAEAAEVLAQRLRASDTVEALRDCEMVIEAVLEDRALKRELIRQCDAVLGDKAIFASNTSTLPIGGLATASTRAQQVLGLHFFSPVPKMALVEIIKGPHTSDETLARAMDFVKQIRKTPIVVNDAHAFYTTRCVESFVREGLRLLAEGVSPARIENAAVGLGMAVGPLTLADEVGLDVLHHIQSEAKRAFGSDYAGDASDALVERMHQAGRKGRKSGAGLFDYSVTGKQIWADLDTAPSELAQQDIAERLLGIQLVVAANAFGQGIVTDAGEADLGAVLGWAFPSHLGGPLGAIDDQGLDTFVAKTDALAARFGSRFAAPAALREMAARGAKFHQPAGTPS